MNWIAVLLALVGVAWLWWRGTRPFANEITDGAHLSRGLRLLLSRGVHRNGVCGTLIVSLRREPTQRLVFTKFIEGDRIGFRGTLPREPWAQALLPSYQAELQRRGIHFRANAATDPDALTFDLDSDFGAAYMIARLLFEDVMGVHLAGDCVFHFRDVMIANSPRFTGVDAPEDGWG